MSNAKWVKGSLTIMMGDPDFPKAPLQPVTVQGYLSQNIAILRREGFGEYFIWHYPSGLGISSAALLRDCKQLVAEMREKFGDLTGLFDRVANNQSFGDDGDKMWEIRSWLRKHPIHTGKEAKP